MPSTYSDGSKSLTIRATPEKPVPFPMPKTDES
jgi:hypothetical protein